MEPRKIRAFLLRLSPSVREDAEAFAREEGISLNQFISLALAERIARMESSGSSVPAREKRLLVGPSGIREATRPVSAYSPVPLPAAYATRPARPPLRSGNELRRP